MGNKNMTRKHYLLASDFDQTLSFNDSGLILSHLIGASDFAGKVSGLSRMHFIQQGGELAYLLLHDPEYRRVRREHLVEAGKQIRLKANIRLLSQLLDNLEGYRFSLLSNPRLDELGILRMVLFNFTKREVPTTKADVLMALEMLVKDS